MDYYMNDMPQMKGQYSVDGEKDGMFSFYYPNGKLHSIGAFKKDHQFGTWEYYYENGAKKSKIFYPGTGTEFVVIEFYDKLGKAMTTEGTGSFEIQGTDGVYPFLIKGQFKDKKRYGVWSYYISSLWKDEALKIREKYDENGFRKGQMFDMSGEAIYSYKDQYRPVLIEYIDKFSNTEIFSRDALSFMRGSTGTIVDFLVDKSKPDVDVKGKSFEESFIKILLSLNTRDVRSLFKEREKKYQGKIIFYLDDSGVMSKFEIEGNVNEQEKKELLYVLQKFKNIHELSFENIVFGTYHTVNFYTIDFRDFLRVNYIKVTPETILLFSMLPYEQADQKLRELFKKVK